VNVAQDPRALDDVAAAILDGDPVNWEALEATSPAPDRDLLPYFRLVARIADAHRGEAGAERPPTAVAHAELAEPEPKAAIPETWGHLKVLEPIGSGAFGEVCRAWDTRLHREVALKLVKAEEPLAAPGEGSAITAEAGLLARVRHPNVVTVYGAERIDGRVGLSMEFIRGRALDEVLRAQGPFSAHEAALVGSSVCRALAAVHRAGLLHRDIKAQNVMREEGGRIVLMDFGTGRALTGARHGGGAGLAGTPLYLAPELFAGGEATVQSDIYGVGVLLFHLVTGSFPVVGATLEGVRQAHKDGHRRFLRDERPDLAGEFVAVIERAIAAEPASRFQTAGAMDAALTRIAGAPGEGAARHTRSWLLAALVVASVVALAITAIPGWRHRALHLGAGPGPPEEMPAPAHALLPGSSTTARKFELPDSLLVGRPSRDGRLFSFSDLDGNLAVVETSTGHVTRLTNKEVGTDQHALYSAISADRRFVAYTWRALDGRYEMRVIDTDGRRPRVVLRNDGVDLPLPLEWSRDGQSILSVLIRPDGTNQLALVGVEDGSVRAVRELGSALPRHASLSPDGELVVYDAPQSKTDSARDIFITTTAGSDPQALVAHPANDFAPVWTPDGRHVVFASDRSGTMDLWRAAVTGDATQGEPDLIHRDIGRLVPLGLTDQGRYYYQRLVGAVEVYGADVSADLHIGRPVPLGPAYAGSNISSIWSPDGRQVAYASRRGLVGFDRRSTTLVISDLRSGERRELVPAMNGFLVRSWSPDGRRILVQGTDTRLGSGLHAIDVETGRTTRVVVADRPSSETDIGRGEWMPDGRVLYTDGRRRALLLHDVERGRDEVALDFRAEGIEGIAGGSNGPGFKASPDGRTLAFCAFVRDGEATVKSLRVKSGAEPSRELLRAEGQEILALQDWTPDGAALLVTRRQAPDPPDLWQVSLGGGDPRPLGFTMKALRDVSMHPDGSRITFTAGVPLLEVWVLENFLALSGEASTGLARR
jgi:serine/threonine-protein kinase